MRLYARRLTSCTVVIHIVGLANDLPALPLAASPSNGVRTAWEARTTARKLAIFIYRAEWVLSIVSGLTLLLSFWISFVLPRQVVKALQELKEAVDHAASGNLIDFELSGRGEVVELAKSVRKLVAQM
jgi:methyl-accepting chemotaxis protein